MPTTEDPAEQPAPSFTIVPTIDGYRQLEQRVKVLEQDVAVEEPPADWQQRLDRHRAELEELKRRYNALADLVRLHLTMFTAPQAPATVPESHL